LKVKVLFFTRLREIVKKKEETVSFDVEKVTVGLVLNNLSDKYGTIFTEYVFDAESGNPKGFLQFLINGANAPNGLDTVLNEGDVLAILPPVGGG
jgi:sulfur-carrier protein